ncbi:MAG: hypothetical protein ACI9R3_000139 [Verrucomicrobiales bacterium]|jgi:hypothetical protein
MMNPMSDDESTNKNIEKFAFFESQGRYRSGATVKIIDETVYSESRNELASESRNGIRIIPDVETQDFPIGVSKFGGEPDLPGSVPWPKDNIVLPDGAAPKNVGVELIQSLPFI